MIMFDRKVPNFWMRTRIEGPDAAVVAVAMLLLSQAASTGSEAAACGDLEWQ
jgi:hypothetical protein